MVVDAIAGAFKSFTDWRRAKSEEGVRKAEVAADNKARILEFRTRELEAQAKVNAAQVQANAAASAGTAKFTARDYAMWTAALAWSVHVGSGVVAWVMRAFYNQPDFPALPHDSNLFYVLCGTLGIGIGYRTFEKVKGVSRTCGTTDNAITTAKNLISNLRKEK